MRESRETAHSEVLGVCEGECDDGERDRRDHAEFGQRQPPGDERDSDEDRERDVSGEHTDTETVRAASRARWGDLLAAGAEIYEYRPTMYHCKVMIVDEFMVSTGSTNFDDRSFRLNDEANLNIYDRAFAAEQVKVFDADLAKSRRMDLATWRARPLREKLVEHLASLLGSQL